MTRNSWIFRFMVFVTFSDLAYPGTWMHFAMSKQVQTTTKCLCRSLLCSPIKFYNLYKMSIHTFQWVLVIAYPCSVIFKSLSLVSFVFFFLDFCLCNIIVIYHITGICQTQVNGKCVEEKIYTQKEEHSFWSCEIL